MSISFLAQKHRVYLAGKKDYKCHEAKKKQVDLTQTSFYQTNLNVWECITSLEKDGNPMMAFL